MLGLRARKIWRTETNVDESFRRRYGSRFRVGVLGCPKQNRSAWNFRHRACGWIDFESVDSTLIAADADIQVAISAVAGSQAPPEQPDPDPPDPVPVPEPDGVPDPPAGGVAVGAVGAELLAALVDPPQALRVDVSEIHTAKRLTLSAHRHERMWCIGPSVNCRRTVSFDDAGCCCCSPELHKKSRRGNIFHHRATARRRKTSLITERNRALFATDSKRFPAPQSEDER